VDEDDGLAPLEFFEERVIGPVAEIAVARAAVEHHAVHTQGVQGVFDLAE
jgi:hypothetical protein